ncbi:K(+)-transporting ATPase subunit F [Elstera cyanobacteriorum]|uniref:K(+)-transporting ATPase subunit F n=1 Tax=Elstera cyanobacteriorum TaxID=2022747 RepID=A0A255XR46_9PROT|nr:K(+)-transporting ATPase subunit F [Elstera cyanobacteriorum]
MRRRPASSRSFTRVCRLLVPVGHPVPGEKHAGFSVPGRPRRRIFGSGRLCPGLRQGNRPMSLDLILGGATALGLLAYLLAALLRPERF